MTTPIHGIDLAAQFAFQHGVEGMVAKITDRDLGIGAAVLAVLSALVALAALVPLMRMSRRYVAGPLVPLPSQPVSFSAAGPHTLYVRGPRTTVWELGGGHGAELRDTAAAEPVRSWDLAAFGTRSAGLVTVQHGWKQFEVPRPGEYVFAVTGLQEGRAYENRLFFGSSSPLLRLALLAVVIPASALALFAFIVAAALLK